MISRAVDRWAHVVSRRPGTVLLLAAVITAGLAAGGANVRTVEQSTDDFLPDEIPVMAAFDRVQAEFGSAGATSYTILVEVAPSAANSTEVRDVRDPRLLRWTTAVENDLRDLDRVTSVEGPSGLFTEVPPTERGVQDVLDRAGEERWSRVIAEDYSAVRVTVEASGLSAAEEVSVAEDIRATVEAHPRAPGIDITYTGQTYIDEAFQEQANRTMAVTSTVALLGVFLVVVVLFRSVYYGLSALMTLIFGIAAGYGLFGYLGYNMSPATSGAISMGVGIAIDFGIQPVARYLEEREEDGIEESVRTMMHGIARPMTLGVIAALFGFASLSTGTITFLSALGILLSLTTLFAYVAAFAVLPPVMILWDRYVSDGVRISMFGDST